VLRKGERPEANRQYFLREMKKIVITVLCIFFAAAATRAQVSSTQTVSLSLTDFIEMDFTATGTATGPTVTMNFNTTNDYANGVTSSAQQIKVMSNRNFNVTVKSSSTSFTYTGTTTPAPVMPVSGILNVMVSANATGGTIAAPFTSYASVTSTNQNLITAGSNGGNQTFSVQYKATPGFTYPAGTYATTVVYTATQQ
jgi:hypothetical protein